jgi:imidazolonepropionase-like amidohydrolase
MKRSLARHRNSPGRSGTLAIAAVACVALVRPLPAQPSLVAIRARAMVDVERGRLIEKATIVVEGGRIVAAGASAEERVPANASVIDLPATTVLPGLIDAHVHLTLGGQPSANARATLAAGFTTVQDLGAATYANIALRDAIRAGRIEGPRVVASGPWLDIRACRRDARRDRPARSRTAG